MIIKDPFWLDKLSEWKNSHERIANARQVKWCTDGEHIPSDIADESEWCCTDDTIIDVLIVEINTE